MSEITVNSVTVWAADGITPDAPLTICFTGEVATHHWALAELGEGFPSDWTDYGYLVLEMRPSSPQRFYVEVHTDEGMRAVRLQPVGQDAWLRAAVPLSYFVSKDQRGYDLASANNRPRNSFWFSSSGPFGSLEAVESIRLRMEYPVGEPTLELRLLGISREDPGSEILEPMPVIDELGQWMLSDWPGKVKDLADLRQEWSKEEADLALGQYGYSAYGGYMATQVEATGFFRVEQVDGKWWFVDPEGHLFWSVGANVMRYEMGTPITGRERYYAAMPPYELTPRNVATYSGPEASFFTWNIMRRYGADWQTRWAEMAVRRMDAWGLNTIYCRTPELIHAQPRKAYILTVKDWQSGPGIFGLPDVYDEGFAQNCDDVAARDCAPYRGDPYLLGYFVGNEPAWPGRESELVDMVLAGPAGAMRDKARAYLAQGDSPARRHDFVLSAFCLYLETINAAVKRHDPKHLNLGVRFGRMPAPEIIEAAKGFDVYSHNLYRYAPEAEDELACNALTGRPVLIGEFHIGAPGKSLGAGLIQARDDVERGVAYQYYVEQAAAIPCMIGAHWFQWMDQPPTGRMDGENYNIGLVDGTDRAHPGLVAGLLATHQRLLAVHSGAKPPSARMPQRQ